MMPIVAPAEELRRFASGDITAAPTHRVTEPMFTLPAQAPGGHPCVGFSFALFAEVGGTLVIPAGGLTLTAHRLVPTLGAWASWEPFTGYQEGWQLVCYDFGAGTGLYFQVEDASVAGNLVICVAALS